MQSAAGHMVLSRMINVTVPISHREKKAHKRQSVLYHEHLIEVLTEVLDKVHVREAGQHQVSGFLGEGHFCLGEPRPVEWV